MPKLHDLLPWLFGRRPSQLRSRPMPSMAEIDAELTRQERLYINPLTGAASRDKHRDGDGK